MNTLPTLANVAWFASSWPEWRRFRAALKSPERTQRTLLRDGLGRNASTAYGRAHSFATIGSYVEFQRQVPLVTYDGLAPWIERIRRGESNVLTCEPVTRLVPTSGSTAARKLIPFTKGLQQEFNRAIGPWMVDLFRAEPALLRGTAYWSITPASPPLAEESSVPIGFEDDASYLGGVRAWLANATMAVPSIVRCIEDIETFRYVTLLCLLRHRDLAIISVWHPSFLTLLLEALSRHWESLVADIEAGGCRWKLPENVRQRLSLPALPVRAAELRRISYGSGGTAWFSSEGAMRAIWPNWRVVSCWGDAQAELPCTALERRLPGVHLQPKGLLATEAVVTIPFACAWPLAIRSHFFEFIDDHGQVRLVHELKDGGEYEVVVTTAGGLWRYRLGDLVRVVGHLGRTPSLKFLGRSGGVSDRFGEKLSETFVGSLLRKLTENSPPIFAMLAPDEGDWGCRYTLYIEGPVEAGLAERLDAALRLNPHYDYCRHLGQLQPVQVFQIVARSSEVFFAWRMAAGQRLGEIKPCALSRESGWSQRFAGSYRLGSGGFPRQPQPISAR